VRVRMGPLELGRLRPGEFRDLTLREIQAMTTPTAAPKPQTRNDRAPAVAPRVTGRDTVRGVAPRIARRGPVTRARVGPVESARAGAPRVTRRAGSSRARVEGTPTSRLWSTTRTAGRPTRERGPRAAAGPAARVAPRAAAPRSRLWRRSTRAAAGRAAPRRRPR
jgi:hypothetical protein